MPVRRTVSHRALAFALENLEARLVLSAYAPFADPAPFSDAPVVTVAASPFSADFAPPLSGASVPAAPSNLTATAGDTFITLTWSDNSPDETNFRIFRSTDNQNFSQYATLPADTTSWTNFGVKSNVTYYYRVAALNSVGTSPSSNTASAAIQTNLTTPVAPTTFHATAETSSSISLAWTDNATNESGYYIYRSTDNTNFTLAGNLPANTTSFADSGLAASTTYYYEVAAWNSVGTTYAASSLSVATQAPALTPPNAPSSLNAANITSSSLTVQWTDNATNESGYYVYRSTDNTNFSLVGNLAANTTSFADSGLAASTTYYYKVAAWNSAGTTYAASPLTAATLASVVTRPNAPTSLYASNIGSSSLTVQWTDNATNESGFYVYRSTDNVNFALVGNLAANSVAFADAGLAASTAYYYKVAAWNSAGATFAASTISATTTAVVVTRPNAPSGLNATNISTTSLTLQWTDNSNNESGFYVYRSLDNAKFTLVGNLAANATSFADSGLTVSTTYYYKVAAWNSAGATYAASTLVTATITPGVTPPNAPTSLIAANITSSSLTVQWTDNATNESGYYVYRSTDNTNFSLVGNLAANTTSFADSGLPASTTYYYKVAAWNSAGATYAASTLTVATLTVVVSPPNAPTSLAFSSITTTTLMLKWNDAGNNDTGVHVYRSTDGANYTLIATLPASTTSLADSGLTTSTTYYYIVGAYNSAGETQSAAATVTTQAPSQGTTFTLNTFNMTSFTELQVVATSANDSILVTQSAGILTITDNGQTSTIANTFGDLKIYGAGGNDSITVDSSVNIATLIYGGDGNDSILNKTSGKATIVTIGNGVNTVTGNGVNTSFWVNPGDTVNASATEIANNAVNRVSAFYQPFTTNPASSSYIPRGLNGQNLPDPTDTGSITRLTHSSFWGTGPLDADVNQGSVGDCYYVAPLASLAYNETLKFMNTGVDLGDGTYAIRFTRNGVTSYVRVDGDLPAGGFVYGLAYDHPGASGNEWSTLYEKAYAFFRTGANTYASLNSGWQGSSFADLGFSNTSIASTSGDATVLATIDNALAAGKAIAASTNTSITGGAPIIGSHCYTIIAAWRDASGTVQIEVRNPWGVDGAGNDGNPNDGLVTISYSVFAANFNYLTCTTS